MATRYEEVNWVKEDDLKPESESSSQMPSLRLDGRVAVVTGAGRGIGRGCAIALAEAGADVMLMARSRSELEETACEVSATGQNVRSIVCDVTDSRQVGEAVDFLEQIGILVNNVGTNVPEPFLEVSEENLDKMLAVNVKGVFLVAQAAARRMVERGESGSIINISSQVGHVGASRRTVYCATKHAAEGLTKAMAVELASHDVRVNSAAPTFVETPMTKPSLENETFREDTLSRIPLGRLGRVEDVTGAVVFLSSPAVGLITGASLSSTAVGWHSENNLGKEQRWSI